MTTVAVSQSKQIRTVVRKALGERAVLEIIKDFSPAELVVSGGAGAAETDEIFRLVGLMKVVDDSGATFFDHNSLVCLCGPPICSGEGCGWAPEVRNG
jgi:hypothetical protein